MNKSKELEIALQDTGNFVKAVLRDAEKLILDYENEEAKPVRIRSPLPEKERIINNAIHWMKNDERWKSVEQWVNFYIHCREKEIYDQINEIRKSIKRIKHYSLSIKIAKEALKEHENKKT